MPEKLYKEKSILHFILTLCGIIPHWVYILADIKALIKHLVLLCLYYVKKCNEHACVFTLCQKLLSDHKFTKYGGFNDRNLLDNFTSLKKYPACSERRIFYSNFNY